MTTRTTSRTVTFQHPFVLGGFAREAPAGTYLVQTEEELLSVAWKRASTLIRVRTATETQHIFIDPEQLDAALLRERAEQNGTVPEAGGRTDAHQSNAQSHRVSRTQDPKET